MNVIDLINDQLAGDVVGKLGSVLGKDQATTGKAVAGAVPSLLSVLAGLATSSGGVEKLISALRTFDAGSLADVVSSLKTGNAAPVQQKGGDLLGSLLGGGTLAAIISALSKFSNLDSGSTKSLLSTLLPIVLAVISNHFKSTPVSAQGLTGFFKEQAGNISAAMPPGLSLGDVPGISDIKAGAGQAASGLPVWLLPLIGLALLGLLGWYFLGQTQPVPAPVDEPVPVVKPVEVAEVVPVPASDELAGQLSKVYTSAIESLTSVKDVPTAEAAAPTLQGLVATLGRIAPLIDKLPEAGKTAIAAIQSKNLDQLKDLVSKVLAIAGVSEKLKPILDDLVGKLTAVK